MQIPEIFKKKVVRVFGTEGGQWLEQLPQLLCTCVEKWNLSDCRLSEILSMNLICFAKSPAYGETALKIGVPHRELFTEMKALSLYKGRSMCICHDSDIQLGAMLLERLVPGRDLNTIKNGRERIHTAAGLISRLPIPAEPGCGLPAYRDWVTSAFKKARQENKVGSRMRYFIERAEALFEELNHSGCPRMLLHGDLHHENMLRSTDGQWKAIDPKGIIGIRCQEAARFIENEIYRVDASEWLSYLDGMVDIFSIALNEPKRPIAISAFVLEVLSICWCFEDAEVPAWVHTHIKACEIFHQYAGSCNA